MNNDSMQKNIHPKYSPFTIHIGDEIFKTMSASEKSNYIMDRDFRKHPAWTKKGIMKDTTGSKHITNYEKKYGKLDFL